MLTSSAALAAFGSENARASVAQLEEQLTLNQLVVGSSPTGGTRNSNTFSCANRRSARFSHVYCERLPFSISGVGRTRRRADCQPGQLERPSSCASGLPGYDVEGFIADPERVSKAVTLDREELGDMGGRSLLHLQCHIGLDTLSWARLGAQVTGLDFSSPAIDAAREISRRAQAPAEFVLADVYEAPEVLGKTYDIVYASEGVLCWLPDVAAWARVLRRLTRPGGTAYIRDGHPIFHALDHDRSDGRLELIGSYFEGPARATTSLEPTSTPM